MQACAVLGAPIPASVIYTAQQIREIGCPVDVEAEFADERGEDISLDYLEQIEQLFTECKNMCEQVKQKRIKKYMLKRVDTILLLVSVSPKSIKLRKIVVRPCFAFNNMLTIVVYQLLKLGIAYEKERVMVTKCLKRTVDILSAKFDGMDDVMLVTKKNHYTAPNCVFADMQKVARVVTAKSLGIDGRIHEEQGNCMIRLNEEAFPSVWTLNEPDVLDDSLLVRDASSSSSSEDELDRPEKIARFY